MDGWLKTSDDNGSKRTADDVEAPLEASANRVFANVFTFSTHWVPVPCYYLFPLNNYHKYTTHSVYYFNREGLRKFLED